MSSVPSSDRSARDHRRRLTSDVREALRDLRIQLGVLNHRVGTRLELKDADLDCLDLIARHGPMSPTALARRAGVHPATMTGILDRLERAGWVARDRDPSDRRAVVVRALRDRTGEVLRLYAGMNRAMDRICAGYGVEELAVVADFLRRTAEAGQAAADRIGAD